MSDNKNINFFFKEVLSKNAPLNIHDNELIENIKKEYGLKEVKVKYPYKYFLIISLIDEYGNDNIFNKELDFSNVYVVKKFYDYVTRDYFLFEVLKNQKNKNNWDAELGFNGKNKSKVYNSVLYIMKQSPVNAISKYKDWVKLTEKNKIILNIESSDWKKDQEKLKELCWMGIMKCIPWYKNMNDIELISLTEYQELEHMLLNSTNPIKVRKYQHIFRKEVLDRDAKCNICCIDSVSILDACHIKPYRNCKIFEAYDVDNGITLCKNHHKLFDSGYFTFNSDWTIKISKKLEEPDIHLLFKQYESCYIGMSDRLKTLNPYLNFHYKNIFND